MPQFYTKQGRAVNGEFRFYLFIGLNISLSVRGDFVYNATMKNKKIRCFSIVSLFAGFAFACAVRADESAAEWFRQPEAVLADAVCVSDTNAFTCGSAPISCVHEGTIYAPYLTARSGHGEQHKVIALSVFPANEPYSARSYVVAEAGAAGPAADCTQVIDPFSIWHDGRVRVYFLANAEHYRFCDWDPATHAVGAASPVKCVWAGAETNELTSVPLAAYLTAKGCTGFNLKADASEHLICTAKPAWHDGAFYGTVTSGSSQPVVFRCADGETFEFVGVVPVIGQYECQVAWLGDKLYALVRAPSNGNNFWMSSDGGANWTKCTPFTMSATRPQLLAWRDRLLVGYSEENVAPNLIRAGRNNMRLKAGAGTEISAYEQAFRVIDPIGFVYYDLVPCGDDLYVLWSNSSVYPDLGGTLSGKDAIFAARLSVSGDEPTDGVIWSSDGATLTVTVRSGAVGPAGGHLFIAWGETDGGDAPDSWANRADLGVVTDAGRSWRVNPAECGIPETCRLRAFVVPAYELVESIASTGSQYLDTGLYHTQVDSVDLDLRMDSFHASNNSEIYGARNDNSGGVSVEAFCGQGTSEPACTIADFCNSSSTRLKITDAVAGKRLKIHLGADGSRIRTDDGSVDSHAGAYSGSFALTRSAWVFGVNGAGWARHPDMTLFSLDVNRDGEPLRRYRPVRFASGAAGLCDLLTGETLFNCGSGTFVVGEATNSVVDTSLSVARSDAGDWSADYNAIAARLTDCSGVYDGERHALELSVFRPAGGVGCTVRWAWNGAPEESDFTHDAPAGYVRPGVYTNVVRITDDAGALAPYVATGVVSIVSRSVMAIPVSGGLDLEVSGAALGTANAALVLTWDSEDRGETVSAWSHCETIVAKLDPTGGTFRVDAAALGMTDGDRSRAFVVPSCPILTYLGATGTQYLDTKVRHQQDDVVELDLTMTAAPQKGGQNAMLYGARDDGSGVKAVEVFQGYANSGKGDATTYADFRNSSSADYRMSATMGSTFDSYLDRPFAVRLDSTGSRIAFADGSFSAQSKDGYVGSFTCSASAYVFSVNGAGWARHPGLLVHGIRISRGGAPYRHFVPAYDENGTAGLLDLVEGGFSANLGTGDFICGEMTNAYVRTGSPTGISYPVTVSLAGDACQGVVTGWQGDYDGEPHAASVQVQYPKAGAVVRWAWTGVPKTEDFTHDEPEQYVQPGVYTNYVRVADESGLLEAWIGTGVVRIVRLPLMASSDGSTLRVSVAPGAAADNDALALAWSDRDEGEAGLGDWPHYAVVATLTAEGGEYAFGRGRQRRLGVPEGAVCRFFVMPAYEVLEYAESTSSEQHVDLRFVPNSDYTAIVDAEVSPEANVATAFGIFGARNSHNANNFSVGADANCAYVDNNNCQNDDRGLYQAKPMPLVKGSRYRFFVGRPCSVSVAGTVTTAEKSWTGARFTTGGTAWLFGIRQGTSQAFTASTGVRIYSCVVSNEVPALVCDVLPVRDSQGEVCLYDSVTDMFLWNEGKGELLAGPHVAYVPHLTKAPRTVSFPIRARRSVGLILSVR